jgi:hypothetical protein
MSTQYYIQIRNSKHGWHRLAPDNYASLLEAASAIESFIHTNPLRQGKLLSKGVFRTVRVKVKAKAVASCIK